MASGMIKTTFILAIVFLMISSDNVQMTRAQICGCNNVTAVVSACQQYYLDAKPNSRRPSRSCCSLLRPIDIPCACAFVTQDVMNLVDMDKAVYVGRSCGRKIASGYQCGNYTVQAT